MRKMAVSGGVEEETEAGARSPQKMTALSVVDEKKDRGAKS